MSKYLVKKTVMKSDGKDEYVHRPDQATLDVWKKTYPESKIKAFPIIKNDKGEVEKFVILKTPTPDIIGEGMTKGAANLLSQVIETMKLCFLGGDKEYLNPYDKVNEHVKYTISMAYQFYEFMQVVEVEVEEL